MECEKMNRLIYLVILPLLLVGCAQMIPEMIEVAEEVVIIEAHHLEAKQSSSIE